jgi:hypothetical protein
VSVLVFAGALAVAHLASASEPGPSRAEQLRFEHSIVSYEAGMICIEPAPLAAAH